MLESYRAGCVAGGQVLFQAVGAKAAAKPAGEHQRRRPQSEGDQHAKPGRRVADVKDHEEEQIADKRRRGRDDIGSCQAFEV